MALASGGCGNEVVVVGGDPGDVCAGVRGEGCDASIGGICVGEKIARSCAPEACACSRITAVSSGAELNDALAAASTGDCIELMGSSYGDVSVPAGVQLLSRQSASPRLGAVKMATKSGLCGVEVRDGLVVSAGAESVAIRKVRVSDAPTRGILGDEGASGRIADTTVVDAGEVGLLMGLSSDVTLERVAVVRSSYFGIAATCGSCGCDEAPPFSVKLRKVAAELVKAHATYQTPDGGWGYYDFRTRTYRPSWSTSFTTATSLVALRDAEIAGVAVPPPVLTRAANNVALCRKPDGTYLYGTYMRFLAYSDY